jgi:hypothetical protein
MKGLVSAGNCGGLPRIIFPSMSMHVVKLPCAPLLQNLKSSLELISTPRCTTSARAAAFSSVGIAAKNFS